MGPPSGKSYRNAGGPLKTGNIGMQKYESMRFLERFFNALTNPQPHKDVVDWRDPQRGIIKYTKNNNRQRLQEQTYEFENKQLSEQIYKLKTEDRRSATKEAGSGWRTGGVGRVVIDCYATENPLAYKYTELHSFEKKKTKRDREIARDNQALAQGIKNARSQLDVKKMVKSYEDNKRRAQFFYNKHQDTELHLNLRAQVREFTAKKNRARNRLKSAGATTRENLDPLAGSASASQRPRSSHASPSRGLVAASTKSKATHELPPWDSSKSPAEERHPTPAYTDALKLANLESVTYSPLRLVQGLRAARAERELGSPEDRDGRGDDQRQRQVRPFSSSSPTSRDLFHGGGGSTHSPPVQPQRLTRPWSAGNAIQISRQASNRNMPLPAAHLRATYASADVAEDDVVAPVTPSPSSKPPPMGFERRKLLLFESAQFVSLDGGPREIRIRVSDVGIILLGDPSRAPLSSGVMLEVEETESNSNADSDSGSTELFVSMKRLRLIAGMLREDALCAELLNVPTFDKTAGLYSSLTEFLTAEGEQVLCDLMLRLVRVQRAESGGLLLFLEDEG